MKFPDDEYADDPDTIERNLLLINIVYNVANSGEII